MIEKKLTIVIPSNNVKERIYTCNVLFGELLRVGFDIRVDENEINTIIVGGEKKVCIEDHFFNRFPADLSYLKKENIPVQCTFFHDLNGESIPIVFGIDKLETHDDEIICGLDIIASSFFMLSRWEEYVQGRQEYGKCDEQLLFSVRNNLCSIPLVHLYEVLLANLLCGLNNYSATNRSFKIKPTHDVDRCYLTGWGELLSNVKSIFKAGNKKKARKLLSDFIWYKLFKPEPFNTFKYFCSCADSFGIKDSFFFKCCEDNEPGLTYTINEDRVKQELKVPIELGHVIGFHPSESTFNNTEQFKKELFRLHGATNNVTVCGRNHGLYCNTITYKQWEDAGAEYVSNFGFQHRFGYRCGIAVRFPLFDVYERRQLKLYELPFVIMDTVMYRNHPEIELVLDEIKEIVDDVINYNGELCLNWHTNVFYMPEMRKYKKVYKFIFNYANNEMAKKRMHF